MKNKIFILCLLFFGGCVVHKELFVSPSYFPKPGYDFEKNPLTSEKVKLGRALFYDPVLSADNSVSCASCHSSFNAFSHTDHKLSHGINNQTGTRNAPALMNLAWHVAFMWDGAIHHLDVQALAPISHPKEMGSDIVNVVGKLKTSKIFPPLFLQAFGDSAITGERILLALSQFQLTLVSNNSKYDSVKQKQKEFTAQESKGYEIFKLNCNSCHKEPLFSTYQFANNGLRLDTTLNDYGRMSVTKNQLDSLKFKIPTLRNWEYTSPYMHDGRFQSIFQVLNHYTKGIIDSPTLAPELKNGVTLSSDEKVDLIAFLLTLNDKSFVFNPDYSYPQKNLKPTEGK